MTVITNGGKCVLSSICGVTMKLLQIASCGYTELSNFLTAIANQKIPSLKAKRKSLLDAICANEGLSEKALQDKLNEIESQVTFNEQMAWVDEFEGSNRTHKILLSVSIKGCNNLQHIIVAEELDTNGALMVSPFINAPVHTHLDAKKTELTISAITFAINKVGEICKTINRKGSKTSRKTLQSLGFKLVEQPANLIKPTLRPTTPIDVIESSKLTSEIYSETTIPTSEVTNEVTPKSCLECHHHQVLQDSDPDDWFNDDDKCVVCTKTPNDEFDSDSKWMSDRYPHKSVVRSERPYHIIKEKVKTPPWCPLRSKENS